MPDNQLQEIAQRIATKRAKQDSVVGATPNSVNSSIIEQLTSTGKLDSVVSSGIDKLKNYISPRDPNGERIYKDMGAQVLADTLKNIPQELSRQIGQPQLRAYAGVASAITRQTLTPESSFQKELYGTDQPLTARHAGSEIGINEDSSFAAPIGFAIGAIDLIPGGSSTKQATRITLEVVKTASRDISLLKDASAIADRIELSTQRIPRTAIDSFAETLVKESNPKTVEASIRGFVEQTGGTMLARTTNESMKIVDAVSKDTSKILSETNPVNIETVTPLAHQIEELSNYARANTLSDSVLSKIASELENLRGALIVAKESSPVSNSDSVIANALRRAEAIASGIDPEATLIRNADGTVEVNTKRILGDAVKKITESVVEESGKAIETLMNSAKGSIDDAIQSLLQEAKKFKTADEFVEGQQKVFRGGDAAIDTTKGFGRGISVSTKEVAERFVAPKNGVVGDAFILSNAKILKDSQIPKDLKTAYLSEAEKLTKPLDLSDLQFEKLQKSVLSKQQDIVEYARKNNFDGVEFLFEEETRIIKSDVLKTKSQLTDIWNKANKLDATPKELGFSKTVRTSPNTTEALAAELGQTYSPLANAVTLEKAIQIIAKGDTAALAYVLNAAEPTAETNTVAMMLVEKFQRAGKIEEAKDLVVEIAEKAKSQGQATQILVLWGRLSPAGILKFAQQELKKVGKSLDTELANKLVKQSSDIKGMTEGWDKQFATAKMLKLISDNVPVGTLKNISLVHSMVLLLNPKTFMRNLIGNLGFAVLENVSDVAGASLDSAMALVTGERTKVLPSILKQSEGAVTGTIQGWKESLAGVNTMNIKTQFDIPQTSTFKGPIGGSLETLLNLELRVFDRMFFQAAYDGSIYNQLKATNINLAKAGKKPLLKPNDAMHEIAVHDALYRTFQDDSRIAQALTSFKRGMNKATTGSVDFGLGDAIIKFPKTPGNLLTRGIEYSPAGFITSLLEMSRPLVGQKFNQKKFVEATSRAFTGSLTLFGTGYVLHKLGILTGESQANPDLKALERTQGIQNYQINVSALKRYVLGGLHDPSLAKMQKGDNLVSYDWFQPAAVPVVMGANISENSGLDGGSMLSQIAHAVATGADTLVDQPVTQGIKKFAENLGYYGVSEAVIKTLAQMPSSFVPTLLNQVRQLIDNQSREVYSPDTMRYMMNSMKYRIPGLSQTLEPSITTMGEPRETYQNGSNNLFNVFFNPMFINKYKGDKVIEDMMDIYNLTGDSAAIPDKKRLQQVVNSEKVTLGPKTYRKFQQFAGQHTNIYIRSYMADPNFAKLTSQEQADELDSLLRDIHAYAKIVVLGDRPTRVSKRVKQMISNQSSVY